MVNGYGFGCADVQPEIPDECCVFGCVTLGYAEPPHALLQGTKSLVWLRILCILRSDDCQHRF
jgi:hypothetical protein